MSWDGYRRDSDDCGTPNGTHENTLYQWSRGEFDITSPPLRPVLEMHMPRTDMRAEEFVLGRTGVTCVLDDHFVKRVSSVSGPAGHTDVHVCDEIVSIEGVQVTSEQVSGFDCVEMCKQAIRERNRVKLAVKDFCTQLVKTIIIDVMASSPMRSIYSDKVLPRVSSVPDLPTPNSSNDAMPPMPKSWGSMTNLGVHANSSFSWSNMAPSTPTASASHQNCFLDDRVYRSPAPNNGDGDVYGEGKRRRGGWTWILPNRDVRFLFYITGGVLLISAWVSWVLRDEASVDQIVSFFDSVERMLQIVPLCACSMYIRGSTYPVPFCRACKPQVLRYGDYSSEYGIAQDRAKLCDRRPQWMLGSCVKSTDTVKYLGRFDTLDDCEAACLGYSVGSERCRSFTYHFAAYRDPRFRHSCWGVTHTKWQKVREYAVTSGRVFGPLVRLQRMILWVVRKASSRVLTGCWQDGQPWEVAMAVVCVLFGLSGVRRAPSHLPSNTDLHMN